jgi:hypothetical protein
VSFYALKERRVNIDELERTLPNGFHDSCLRQLTVDYEAQMASLVLDVWIGDVDAPTDVERDRLRTARLDLIGVEYFILEPPDPTYPYRDAGSVTLDLCDSDPGIASSRPLALGGFAGRFFVNQWNAFIHFAAQDVRLTWTDPG